MSDRDALRTAALDEMRGFDGTVDWAGFGSALMVHRPLIEAAIRAKKP